MIKARLMPRHAAASAGRGSREVDFTKLWYGFQKQPILSRSNGDDTKGWPSEARPHASCQKRPEWTCGQSMQRMLDMETAERTTNDLPCLLRPRSPISSGSHLVMAFI